MKSPRIFRGLSFGVIFSGKYVGVSSKSKTPLLSIHETERYQILIL
jgi:hypothetical protein